MGEKIAIFYHNYQLVNSPDVSFDFYENLYEEQIYSLATSGLLEACQFLHIGILGETTPNWVPKKSIITYHPKELWNRAEAPTLRLIRDFCLKEENQDYKILYFHQKGLKDIGKNCKRYWRIVMEYFLIHRWKEAIKTLDNYDCVGVNYVTDTFLGRYPHFSGNFWWANAKHIKNLDHSYLDDHFELGAMLNGLRKEFWIGSSANLNPYCIHDTKMGEGGHYHHMYPPQNYIDL